MLQVADLFLEATKKKVNSLVSRTPRITYTVTVIETFFFLSQAYVHYLPQTWSHDHNLLIACSEYDVKCYWFQTSGRWSVRYLKSTYLTLPRQRLHMIVRHAQYASFALRSGDGLGTRTKWRWIATWPEPAHLAIDLHTSCYLSSWFVVSSCTQRGCRSCSVRTSISRRKHHWHRRRGESSRSWPWASWGLWRFDVPVSITSGWTKCTIAAMSLPPEERRKFVGSAEVQSSWPEWEKACCTVVKPTPDIRASRVCQNDSGAWSGCVASSCHESQLVPGSSRSNSLPACWKLFRETKTNGFHTGAFPYLQKLIIAVTIVQCHGTFRLPPCSHSSRMFSSSKWLLCSKRCATVISISIKSALWYIECNDW